MGLRGTLKIGNWHTVDGQAGGTPVSREILPQENESDEEEREDDSEGYCHLNNTRLIARIGDHSRARKKDDRGQNAHQETADVCEVIDHWQNSWKSIPT